MVYLKSSFLSNSPTSCLAPISNSLLVSTPSSIDWSTFKEEEDNTEGSQTLACTGNACEIS